MALEIVPYTEQYTLAVTAFNRRLADGDVAFRFPEHHIPNRLPKIEGRSIYQEYFLAVEDEHDVRGGYILKRQPFAFDGRTETTGNYQLPLSEGAVNQAYSRVGLQLLTHALRRSPSLFALGMGGLDRPLPQMLGALGWRLTPVPFYFRVCHPRSFLRNLRLLRDRPAWRLLSDVAAATGFGHLGIISLQASRKKRRSRLGHIEIEVLEGFDRRVNEIWNRSSAEYSFIAVRTLEILNVLYPPDDARFHRLLVNVSGRTYGWAVVMDTKMSNHKQFGDMRLGSIVDCLAAPGDADYVVTAATDFLEERGVDLVVSNQSHPAWCSALANTGFLSGPSNFILATSRNLTGMIEDLDKELARTHLNRGDGDGPIHL
jgi:hypothetical protein